MSNEPDVENETAEAAEPFVPVPPIENRFLFVDVAAQRAKQLRRGARPRIQVPQADPAGPRPDAKYKPERVAIEEVRQGLILYELPPAKART